MDFGHAFMEVGVRHVVVAQANPPRAAEQQFLSAFYPPLLEGKSVQSAFMLGQQVVENVGARAAFVLLPEEALKHQKEALAIELKMHGDRPHSSVAGSYTNLGCIYEALKEPELALQNFQKALNVQLLMLVPDTAHPNIADSHSNLGRIYVKLGRRDALESFQKALAMRLKLHKNNFQYPEVAPLVDHVNALQESLREVHSQSTGLASSSRQQTEEESLRQAIKASLVDQKRCISSARRAQDFGTPAERVQIEEEEGDEEDDDLEAAIQLSLRLNSPALPAPDASLLGAAAPVVPSVVAFERPDGHSTAKGRACSACTLINPAGASHCTICGTELV